MTRQDSNTCTVSVSIVPNKQWTKHCDIQVNCAKMFGQDHHVKCGNVSFL